MKLLYGFIFGYSRIYEQYLQAAVSWKHLQLEDPEMMVFIINKPHSFMFVMVEQTCFFQFLFSQLFHYSSADNIDKLPVF